MPERIQLEEGERGRPEMTPGKCVIQYSILDGFGQENGCRMVNSASVVSYLASMKSICIFNQQFLSTLCIQSSVLSWLLA